MKLIMAIVQDADADRLTTALAKENFRSTKLASTGGFLGSGNTTLLIGTEDEAVEAVLAVIRRLCRSREQTAAPAVPMGLGPETFIPVPIEVTVGGATIFVLAVDQFVKI